MFTAAAAPSRSRTGAATDLSPSSGARSTMAHPCRRTPRGSARFAEPRPRVYEQIRADERDVPPDAARWDVAPEKD